MKHFKAWAIDLNNAGGYRYGYAGVFLFNWKGGLEDHQDGMRTALFRTRKQARKAVKTLKKTWPNAAVRRVEITIHTI